jgi:hypothetical protein
MSKPNSEEEFIQPGDLASADARTRDPKPALAGGFRRVESFEDQARGVVTYELGSGQRVRIDARAVAELGAREILRRAGHDVGEVRALPVIQEGRQVGTLPSDFDPVFAKSRSMLYDFRSGDFRLEGDKWIAAPMLGLGDLVAAGVAVQDHRAEQDHMDALAAVLGALRR